MRRLAIVLGVLAALLLAGGVPALAVPPLRVSGQITDQVNALAGSDRQKVQSALDDLQSAKGIRGYQFRAPAEWFAELYAAFHMGKLKPSHPSAGWLQKLKQESEAESAA